MTFGCTGPTIQDCHSDSAGYRIPLALALSQAPLGSPDLLGFNVTTMGTDTTGPSYVPSAWTHHCGFPGWTIPMIDNFLPKAFASSKQSPDLITMCVLEVLQRFQSPRLLSHTCPPTLVFSPPPPPPPPFSPPATWVQMIAMVGILRPRWSVTCTLF